MTRLSSGLLARPVPAKLLACLSPATLTPGADESTEVAPERGLVGAKRQRRTTPRVGDRLGRYVVRGVLGSGGMGVVLDAYDQRLRREVALKLLHPEVEQTGFWERRRRRLIREAKAMAQLAHPNVIAVYDVGSVGDDLFVAMERVDGGDLRGWLSCQKRTWKEIVDAFVQAGAGLAAAHEAGLIHRDFKPGNVLVGRDRRIRVVDFGLARALRGPGSAEDEVSLVGLGDELDTMTVVGAVVGTPAYMSPEQHQGESAGPRSDQYSFCVALFEALYGRRPAAGNGLRYRSQVLEGRLDLTQSNSRVPARVHAAVTKGLSLDPQSRHGSMQKLIAELSAPRSWRRTTVAAAVMLVVGLGVTYPIAEGPPSGMCGQKAAQLPEVWGPRQRSELAVAFESSGLPSASTVAASVAQELDRYLAGIEDAYRRTCDAQGVQRWNTIERRLECLADRRLTAQRLVDELVTAEAASIELSIHAVYQLGADTTCDWGDVEAALRGPQPLASQQADVRVIMARADEVESLIRAGRPREAEALARKLLDAAVRVDHGPTTAEILFQVGIALAEQGKFELALQSYREAAWTAEAARADALAATVWARMAEALVADYGVTDGLEEAVRRAEVASERAGTLPRWRRYRRSIEAMGAMVEGRYPEAIEGFAQVIDGMRALHGDFHPNIVATMVNLGNAQFALGRYDDALVTFQAALDLLREHRGADHPTTIDIRLARGNALFMREDYDNAIADYEIVAQWRREHLGADDPALGNALNNLGSALLEAGRRSEALVHLRRGLEIKSSQLGDDHPRVASSEIALSGALLAEGRVEEAVELSADALRIYREHHGSTHPQTLVASASLAAGYGAAGRDDEIVRLLAPVSDAASAMPAGHDTRLRVEYWYARGLAALGRRAEAALRAESVLGQSMATGQVGGPPIARVQWLLARTIGRSARAQELAEVALKWARLHDTAMAASIRRWRHGPRP